MSLNKKAITTIVICGLAYILLAVLVVLGYSGRLNASCISICVMTNAITAIYSHAFSGKKSFVFMAILSFAANAIFLILRVNGRYPYHGRYPSDGELVGSIVLIVVSIIWIIYSIKLLRKE